MGVGDAMDYFVYIASFAALGWFENQVKSGYKFILLLAVILFSSAYILKFSETLHFVQKHTVKGASIAILTAILIPLLFIGSIFLRWIVFFPIRFTNWIATFPKMKPIL